jgi:hypothetical protein
LIVADGYIAGMLWTILIIVLIVVLLGGFGFSRRGR